MEEYKVSPGHWVIGGYSVSQRRHRSGKPQMYSIYLGPGEKVVVHGLERVRQVIREITEGERHGS